MMNEHFYLQNGNAVDTPSVSMHNISWLLVTISVIMCEALSTPAPLCLVQDKGACSNLATVSGGVGNGKHASIIA